MDHTNFCPNHTIIDDSFVRGYAAGVFCAQEKESGRSKEHDTEIAANGCFGGNDHDIVYVFRFDRDVHR